MSDKKKTDPRMGLVGLTADQEALFEECFKQFRVQTTVVSGDVPQQLHREKFEGIVVAMGPGIEEILRAARSSPSNKRVMIFAVCQSSKEMMPHAQYGINAIFEEPVSKQTILKVVRATYLLIVNEFRKYLRIPIVLPVQFECGGRSHAGSSCELSAGGMSLAVPATADIHDGEACQVTFTLPDSRTVRMPASVCWVRKAISSVGLKFAEDQADRDHLKKWIDDYLGLK